MPENNIVSYWFTNGMKKLRGFLSNGDTYLRADELFASAAGEHPDDRCRADALYDGFRARFEALDGQVMIRDLPDGPRLLYVRREPLETYLHTFDPDSREFDLVLRAIDLFANAAPVYQIEE